MQYRYPIFNLTFYFSFNFILPMVKRLIYSFSSLFFRFTFHHFRPAPRPAHMVYLFVLQVLDLGSSARLRCELLVIRLCCMA